MLRRMSVAGRLVGIGAGDADPEVLALDLDLGEILLVEQFGDGPDQVLIRLAMPWSFLSVSRARRVDRYQFFGQSTAGRAYTRWRRSRK